MYLGRLQLGTWLDVLVQCQNAAGEPAVPSMSPLLQVRRSSDSLAVYSRKMPFLDKTIQVGLFAARVFISSVFAPGHHSADVSYRVVSRYGREALTFEVVGGGSPYGCGLSVYYLHKPQADYIVWQTESGSILRGKNPRVD